MTPLLTIALVAHIVLGIAAVALSYFALLQILKKEPNYGWMSAISAWAVGLFFVSWATSAYYYVAYYGGYVKPVIKASDYSWAHTIFMEGKEHIFLIIPCMALTALFGARVLRKSANPAFKKALTIFVSVLVVLGLFVALSGIVVSGAAQ